MSNNPQKILLGLLQASSAAYVLAITLISNAMIYLTVLGKVKGKGKGKVIPITGLCGLEGG